MTDKKDLSDLYPERVLTASERVERARRSKSSYGGDRFHRTAERRAEEHKIPEDDRWIKARKKRGSDRPWVIFKESEWTAMTIEERCSYQYQLTNHPNNYYQLRDKVGRARSGTVVRSSLRPPRRF